MADFTNPLIVQSDRTMLLDVHAPRADECRNALIPFAELIKSPEHLHTYQLSPLSLWNAVSAGFSPEKAVAVLEEFARYEVPQSVSMWITETAGRFGKFRLVEAESSWENGVEIEYLYLVCSNPYVFKEVSSSAYAKKNLVACQCKNPGVSEEEKKFCFILPLTERGTVKQNLLNLGWPVKDDVPLKNGTPMDISFRSTTLGGREFEPRKYQKEAVDSLLGDLGPGTGFGTIVLPCGAGKTIVGMEVMNRLKTNTLIVTTNISAVHQWINELLDKTNLTRDQIGEYTGEEKIIKPVTVATYQVLTWRPNKTTEVYPHFALFRQNNWGLVIYDEVHMLPAPVFRVAAELQGVRRVGLTATLVREDGMEGHVFSLVGPKRYDVPWKDLERDKWIAKAVCIEIRLDLPEDKLIDYAVATSRTKLRIASDNPAKMAIVKELVERYPEDKILVIGLYLEQLAEIATMLGVPVITGKMPNSERDKIYADFKSGKIRVLVVSKVANFAIDLPDASLAIQVSGTFGSRQEEAQRLGRILRPKERTSRFFTLITRNTSEEDFGANRQKFLAEQGYAYQMVRYVDSQSLNVLDENCALEYKG